MITKADITARRDEILAIARRNGASNVRIFGSVARGEAAETSDLDLLVRFDPDRDLMDHGMLIEELQELLGVKVDVVSQGALTPRDRFGVVLAREAIPLTESRTLRKGDVS
jgi:predicted nucleotidyltransferase